LSYVLVSLVGDDATRESDHLSQHIEQHRTPFACFRNEDPSHESIKEAVNRLRIDFETSSGVIFGHGGESGESLKAYRDTSRIWSTPEQFADMFRNSRVYVFACQTVGRPEVEGMESFGEEAIRCSVSVYVGHYMDIASPTSSTGLSEAQVRQLNNAASAAILKFLDGCEDEKELRRVIQDAFIEKEFVFDTEVDDSFGVDGSTGWGTATLMKKIHESLRVFVEEKRSPVTAYPEPPLSSSNTLLRAQSQ